MIAGLEAAWALAACPNTWSSIISPPPWTGHGSPASHVSPGAPGVRPAPGFITDPARVRHPQDSPKSNARCPTPESVSSRALFRRLHPRARRRAQMVPGGGRHAHPRHQQTAPGDLPGQERHTASPVCPMRSPTGAPTPIRTFTSRPGCPLFRAVAPLPAGPEGRGQGGQQAGAHLPPRPADQDPPSPAQGRPVHRCRRLSPQGRPLHHQSSGWAQGEAAKLGPAVGEFAERLFEGDHPWSKIRQGHKGWSGRPLLRPGWTPPVSGPWTSTSSTCTAWSAS